MQGDNFRGQAVTELNCSPQFGSPNNNGHDRGGLEVHDNAKMLRRL